MSPRLSRISSNLLVAAAAVVIALVVAESIARYLDVRPVFGVLQLGEDTPTRTVDGVVVWNDRSPRYSRDDLARISEDRNVFQIVALGDSILYGVSQPKEKTYLEMARREIERRSGRKVEVLNLAVPGFNTMQENAVYKEIEDQVRPNLVIVHYWGNDAEQYKVVGGYVVDVGDRSESGRLVVRLLPLPARLNDLLLEHSRLYDLLTQVMVAHRRKKEPDWTRVAKPLAEIQERVERAGGRLLVLASVELDKPHPQPTADLSILKEFAATRGIEVIDLSEWLGKVDSKDIAMDGVHFNEAGHRLLGERLADYLLAHDLSPQG